MGDCDPELDFLSPQFNALKALQTFHLHPPIPACPLDNIRRCRQLLPVDHPDHFAVKAQGPESASGHPTQAAVARELQKSRVSYIQQKQRQQQRPNPINEIAERVTEGPLLLLRRCFEKRLKVKVILRHERGIRGYATGTLVAFDKHFNLVLKDAEELYTVLLKVERITSSGKQRWCHKQDKRRRQLKQVFIKGVSVVMVCHLHP